MTSSAVMGRLTREPNPALFELLYGPSLAAEIVVVLPFLLKIDSAHIVMLDAKGHLPRLAARKLLALNQEMTCDLASGRDVLCAPEKHRGLYFVYERRHIDVLGAEVGGAAHVARSRNDINATVTRLRLRDELLRMIEESAAVAASIATVARLHAETMVSGFTHLQPSQPTTLGHYLAAVLSELLRSIEGLSHSYDYINQSPMGAAGGQGTSFPIDQDQVAKLLGFAGVLRNSIDAVASRDYVVHVLSGLSLVGTLLTRFATDLQTWSCSAYGFLDWSDDFVSTSSIMPQKRNAFVLETIRGQAVSPQGALLNTLTAMKNVPFTNSVEISSEAVGHVWPALAAIRKAVGLTKLLVDNLQVNRETMKDFVLRSNITMTSLADLLVKRCHLAFRSAHDVVGRLVNENPGLSDASSVKRVLEKLVPEMCGQQPLLEQTEIAEALDPWQCVSASRYGGGASPVAMREQLHSLTGSLNRLLQVVEFRKASLQLSERALADAVESILGKDDSNHAHYKS